MRRGPTVGVAGPATAAGVTNACIVTVTVLRCAAVATLVYTEVLCELAVRSYMHVTIDYTFGRASGAKPESLAQ